MSRWLLPEYIEDAPPALARRMERARRILLDWLAAHDYQLVIPPLAEHWDSLARGGESGGDLDSRTFKFTDTMSGRTLGVRADITPQAARIDAEMQISGANRLCYCGPTLLTRPPLPWQSREIMQIGAELYGVNGIDGDWESVFLAVGGLAEIGLADLYIDLGHAGVFNALAENLPTPLVAELRAAVSRRDSTAIRELKSDIGNSDLADEFCAMTELNGDSAILNFARKKIRQMDSVAASLDELESLGGILEGAGFSVGYDLGELGGYAYHSGAVFSVYAGDSLAARGGRYDSDTFGILRPSVGFTMDLKQLAEMLTDAPPPPPLRIPIVADDSNWRKAVNELRSEGRRIRFVNSKENCADLMRNENSGAWQLRKKK